VEAVLAPQLLFGQEPILVRRAYRTASRAPEFMSQDLDPSRIHYRLFFDGTIMHFMEVLY
jgi:hypothetical protein